MKLGALAQQNVIDIGTNSKEMQDMNNGKRSIHMLCITYAYTLRGFFGGGGLLYLRHVEVPRSGMKPTPQQ